MRHIGRRRPRTADHRRFDRFAATKTFALVAAACCAIDLLGPAAAQTAPAEPPQQAEPSQAGSPEAAPAPERGATPATVLDDKDVETILGKEIYSAAGEDMGRIVDILVDRKGEARAAIIDFGGFLGVGSRKVAVDWGAIQFASGEKHDRIILSLTRDQVRVAPEYKQGEPIVVLGPSSAAPPPATAPAAPGAPAK